MKKEPSKEEYQQIVKNLTPKHNSLLNCTKAFVTGGTFCVLGEVMKQLMMKYLNLSKKDSLLYVTIELILLSVLLTGFNFYGKITKFEDLTTYFQYIKDNKEDVIPWDIAGKNQTGGILGWLYYFEKGIYGIQLRQCWYLHRLLGCYAGRSDNRYVSVCRG